MELRPARATDLDAVLALDRACSPVFARRSSYATQLAGPHLLLVAARDAALLGFASWNAVIDEATLVNLAVAPRCRRAGLGRCLLERSRALLAGRGIRRLLLEVRESNVPARRLYEVCGFSIDGRREGYYGAVEAGGAREAALLMSGDAAVVPAVPLSRKSQP
jgi:ribosomal-protein-alanine N-acetyltransferase